MSIAKELVEYLDYKLDDLKDLLAREGFDTAYGTTYSLQEIRKAIRDQQPAFVRLGNSLAGQTVYIIGENENSLVAYRDGSMYNISDDSLMKAWTGEAVIVLDKKQPLHKANGSLPAEMPDKVEPKQSCDFVIFDSVRDNWDIDHEAQKATGKRQITRVNQLGLCELPAHPVIVVFRKPSDEFRKKGIRAANGGAEIQIYDPTDPFTEFLHELGHLYWKTQLNDDEKKQFEELHSKLDQKKRPAIFMAQWDSHDGEEIFCTVYYWYCKGRLSHEGYTRILTQQYPEGHAALTAIIKRLHDDLEIQSTMKARLNTNARLWKASEKEIAVWLNHIQGKPSLTLVKGKGFIKSLIKVPDVLPYDFPETIAHKVLGEHNGRKWVMLEQGILRDRVIVLKGDCLDVPYMKSKKTFHLVPKTRVVKHGDRSYRRLVYLSPATVLKAEMDEPAQTEQVPEPRQTFVPIGRLKEIAQRVMNRLR